MNEVEIVVTGQDKTSGMFQSIQGNVKSLGKSFDDLRTNVKNTFNKMHDDIHTKLSVTVTQAKVKGTSVGKELIGGILGSVKSAAGGIQDTFQGVFSGGLKGALSSPIVGPIVLAAMAVVAQAIAGPLAAMIGGALILGLGAGLVGMGAMVLLQNEKLKEKLGKQWEGIQKTLERAFKPLIPVLEFVMDTLGKLAKQFEPVINAAMKIAEGPLKRFIDDLADAFRKFEPAIIPIMDAFSQILDGLGPQLPGLFESIANSLIELSKTVSENSDIIVALFSMIFMAIPPVIDTIGWLIRTFRSLMLTGMKVFSTIASGALGMADGVLAAVQSMLEALAKIPGPWQKTMQNAAAAVGNARKEVQRWKDDVERMPKIIELQAEINQLMSKLTTAKRNLKDPNLTKERKAKINADIQRLKGALAEAQRRIDGLRGKTVTINENWYRNYYESRQRLFNNKASGGVIGADPGTSITGRFQNGGQSGVAGTLALVGEQGPEVVRLPFGSSVTPAGQTESMLSRIGSGGDDRPIAITLIIGNQVLGEILVDPLRKAIRTRGGNVQAVLGK